MTYPKFCGYCGRSLKPDVNDSYIGSYRQLYMTCPRYKWLWFDYHKHDHIEIGDLRDHPVFDRQTGEEVS